MKKQKKIAVAVIAAVCAVLIGAGVIFAVAESKKTVFTLNDYLPDG